MSMAGGWFFLSVSEAFVLSLAIERGNSRAQVFGVLTMPGMVVFVDQLLWRPVVAWAQKFTDEETDGAESWLWERVRRSRLWNACSRGRPHGRDRRRLQPARLGPAQPSGTDALQLEHMIMEAIHAVFGGFFLGAAMPRGLFTRELTRQLESFSVVFLLPMYARRGMNHPQGRGLFSTANPRVARGLMTGLVTPVKPE